MPFSTDELSRMQATQEAAMMDSCVLVTKHRESTDGYGNPVYGELDGAEIACGFDPTASREVPDGSEVAITDAQLRLPLAQEVNVQAISRVTITRRFGVVLASPLLFDVIGLPERGPSGLVLNLVRSQRPDTETK